MAAEKHPVVTDAIEGKPKEELLKEVTGIKNEAKNTPAASELKKVAEEEGLEDNFDYPSLFVGENDVARVNVQILFDPATGKPLMMAVVRDLNRTNSELRFLKRTLEWAEFSLPSYDNMVAYRESSMSYHKETNQYLADPVKMRLCYIRYHLKNWSVKVGGKVIELIRDGRGLSDDTMRIVLSITPSLMDMFLTEFERESMLLA